MEDAHHGWIGARKHSQDAAFGAIIVAFTAEFDQHLVAMHGRAECAGMDVYVAFNGAALPGIGDDETETIAVHVEPASD